METFIQRHRDAVIGVLSGWDRLRLRGTLRSISHATGLSRFLSYSGRMLKGFGEFALQSSRQIRAASLAIAQQANRPIEHLQNPGISKEAVAQQYAVRDGIKEGLICILTSVEPCQTYEVFRNREEKKAELQPRIRKCLFLYHYWIDAVFGFMNARIQSWFPFSIQVCLNGREWLGRQMDRKRLNYQRKDNCFPWIERVDKAQKLMDQQLQTHWPVVLDRIAHRLNPSHQAMLAPFRESYYWSTYQSEWATDIMFKSPAALAKIYPTLVRSGISVFGSGDVLRFLGKKLHGNFKGEVVSHYGQRPEGVRLKHAVKGNSVKVYDKQGSVLRIETTVNHPRDFKVYRPKEGASTGAMSWQRMRQGVADLYRRAEISQASNERYLNALASIRVDRLLGEVVESLCRPTLWRGHRVRSLRPWSMEDSTLLKTISRGEFNINGFRNRDLLSYLFPGTPDGVEAKRRISARITHRLRMLRAHGIIRRVPHTFRYVMTDKGRQIATAIIHTQHIPITRISELAA